MIGCLEATDMSYFKNMKDARDEASLFLEALTIDQKFIEQDNYD